MTSPIHLSLLETNKNYKNFIETNNLSESKDLILLDKLSSLYEKSEDEAAQYLKAANQVFETFPNVLSLHEKTMSIFQQKKEEILKNTTYEESSAKIIQNMFIENEGIKILNFYEFFNHLSTKYNINFQNIYEAENQINSLPDVTLMILGFSDQEIEVSKRHYLEDNDICQFTYQILKDYFKDTVKKISVLDFIIKEGATNGNFELFDFDTSVFDKSDSFEIKKFKELFLKELKYEDNVIIPSYLEIYE